MTKYINKQKTNIKNIINVVEQTKILNKKISAKRA